MGWNQLDAQRRVAAVAQICPKGASVYFVHGYHVVPADEPSSPPTTDYGRPFVSSIWRDNVMATQFHPEKSQKVGLQILSNFASL